MNCDKFWINQNFIFRLGRIFDSISEDDAARYAKGQTAEVV